MILKLTLDREIPCDHTIFGMKCTTTEDVPFEIDTDNIAGYMRQILTKGKKFNRYNYMVLVKNIPKEFEKDNPKRVNGFANGYHKLWINRKANKKWKPPTEGFVDSNNGNYGCLMYE